MGIEKDKDVINNNRLANTLIQGVMPEILTIFEIPIINGGLTIKNLALKKHFELTLVNLLIAIANINNVSKAMLKLEKLGLTDLTESQVEDFYTMSCKGLATNSFLLLDSYVSRPLHTDLDFPIPDNLVLQSYGDRYSEFNVLIADMSRSLEDFGIAM